MSGAMDTAGGSGAAQTWPLLSVAPVTAVPLPTVADATATTPPASPHPSPLPHAGEAAGVPPADAVEAAAAAPALPMAMATTAQAPQPASLAQPTGSAGMVGSTVLALLLVVGVILALAWLAKRMPGLGAAGGGNPALKVVGSLALGPRERVVVVDVGGTQLLLSTGPHGTRALHTLEQPLPALASAPSPFAQVLARQFGKTPS